MYVVVVVSDPIAFEHSYMVKLPSLSKTKKGDKAHHARAFALLHDDIR